MLLKDNRVYCNNCGKNYDGAICCEDPQIGSNADVAQAVAAQCRYQRETAANEHASTKNKALRFGISLPPFMYEALENYERMHGRKLIADQKDINWLMREYPMYAIPRKR